MEEKINISSNTKISNNKEDKALFTIDNTKRPTDQKIAFTKACIDSVMLLTKEDCEILVLGNTDSNCFPEELLPFTTRKKFGHGGIKANFLINYGWEWDLNLLKSSDPSRKHIQPYLHSKDISISSLKIGMFFSTLIALNINVASFNRRILSFKYC